MPDLWYKNAVIYCLDVETFVDANGDGVGDFRGLMDRLDHLETLGVSAVWLNPFYPSPNRDNGYDVTDFYGVDSRHGNAGDFVDFVHAASDHGLKVIVDLVANHTSIDHPWFRSARSSRESPYRDWYVWSDTEPEDLAEGIIFPGVQETVWTQTEETGAWYMHRFYAHQADLNIANPEVRAEIIKVMGYWLELGVAGFRIDAVPFLIEYKGLKQEPDRDPFLLLSEMHDFLTWRRAEAIMLAESNVPVERARKHFGGRAYGEDERMHVVLDFPLNQRTWLAMVRGEAAPIVEALQTRDEEMPEHAQWATFIRNHDELSLDKLSDAEREEVFAALAPEEDMRIYDRGVRRRMAPMLGGDEDRLKLAHSLLMALPGTPVMWYGDEIGMGENLSLSERNPVRTPMQWSGDRNGGFSSAEGELVRAVADTLGPEERNVASQRERPGSLMDEVARLIRLRRGCPEIGWGRTRVLDPGAASVLALASEWRGGRVVTLHNLAARTATLRLDVGPLMPLLGEDRRPIEAGAEVVLPAYGYRWFRIGGERA
jgi:maltose alpha-D-glucosyltransferase / alpha-amylase